VAMADMKAAEDKLEAAYAVDTTAFSSQTRYSTSFMSR